MNKGKCNLLLSHAAEKTAKSIFKSHSPLFCQYGMTLLVHAAYKGKADMCRLLLKNGANVNCNQHEYGYTAVTFAGLSGKLTLADNSV